MRTAPLLAIPLAASSLFLTGVLVVPSPVLAQTVYWTDWTSATVSTTEGEATGTLTLPDNTTIDVTYSGDVTFANINGEGPNYWLPEDPYISLEVPTSPAGTVDIIAQSEGASVTNTVTFSRPIEDALFAVVSLNNADHLFSLPIEVVSYGCGFWGCGTLFIQDETTLGSTGEGHGVVRIPGAVTSFTFQHTVPEFWTGFTIGIAGLAPVPTEPDAASLGVTALLATYPNPARVGGAVVLPFRLNEPVRVRLVVYDVLGREVHVVAEAPFEATRHAVVLDTAGLASGTYLVRMTTDGGFAQTQRVTLMR